ncbi:unnamed protein product [Symbiodinium natans]|uniref:Uncharacterized protein n=1 Tax=Symbiodinium natans TaxID=878477 RepID=A0A812NQU5_9DINO|nr:unnamed protein product [Symbiodinium natans]
MAQFADVAAAAACLHGLDRSDLVRCRAACQALRESACDPLTALLVKGRPTPTRAEQRVAALRAMGSVSAPKDAHRQTVANAAAGFLRDKEASVRLVAVATFAKAAAGLEDAATTAVSALGPVMTDVDPGVNAAAGRALLRLVPREHCAAKQVASLARRQMRNRDEWVICAALEALARFAGKSDALVQEVAPLVRGSPLWTVRLAAARALPALAPRGDAVACAALKAGADDHQPAVRRVAAAALIHLAASPWQPLLDKKAAEWEAARRPKRRKVARAGTAW